MNRPSRAPSDLVRTHLLVLFCVAAIAAPGCGGGDEGAGSDEMEGGGEAVQATLVRDACEVLTGEDASAIIGQVVEARPDLEDQGPRYSSCSYFPSEGYAVLYLTVYWSGGEQEWETWLLATRYAKEAWDQAEKVDLDSITGAGLVSGLGDRAYFGGMLPSLVLKGDILLEFKMPLVMDEEEAFPQLALAALAKLE